MTRLWSRGDPIQVVVDAGGLPVRFEWQGHWHEVATVANRWRVRAGWWQPGSDAWREYVKLTTVDGLLCTLYCDLNNGAWCCARVYD